MLHDIQKTVSGKRKRREASSATERPQARIDQYFATKAPVKQPSIDNGHAHGSSNLVHTVQVLCDSASVSQMGLSADTSQAHSPKHQLHPQQASRIFNISRREEHAIFAADRQVAEAHCTSTAQGDRLPEAKSAEATAVKASSKPNSALRKALQLPHPVPKPPSAAAAQPDLAEHLSFFLSVLPERQQFRE